MQCDCNKSNNDKVVIQETVKEIIISIRKMGLNTERIENSVIKIKHSKISKLLENSSISKFVTKELVEENDLPSGQYSVTKSIRLKTSMLRSDFYGYSDAYIVAKGTTTVARDDDDKKNIKN